MSKTIEIDGIEYVPKGSETAESFEGMKYVIVRSRNAGCFAAYLESKDGTNVKLRKARRLWYWSGASSLSQLAMEGVKNPEDCKFPCEVDSIEVDGVCEVIDTTKEAQSSINSVDIWKQ